MESKSISKTQLNQLITSGNAPKIFDVRKRPAFSQDPRLLPGASWQPHDQVERWGADLSQNRIVVVYCVHGHEIGQIALMHRELVEERSWLSEKQFLNALNFCMLLPGPEAMQLATYAGWKMHGEKGGLIAGLLFVIPGALVVFVLSALYAVFGKVPFVEAVFLGIKAAVLAIVIEALIKVSKRAANTNYFLPIAIAAFIALFFFSVPFPLVIALAAIFGMIQNSKTPAQPVELTLETSITSTLLTTAKWLTIWLLPLALLAIVFGPSNFLTVIGLFFSKLAVVTFGGAYAVLAYMAQQAVENFGWLTAAEMVDGLGLAETTPGPSFWSPNLSASKPVTISPVLVGRRPLRWLFYG